MSRARSHRSLAASRAALALASLGIACAPAPTSLTWQVQLEDASLLSRAAVVDARILRGGCDGPEIYGAALRPRGAMALAPPALEPGVWGFAASAHDASCVRFADVCDEITLQGVTSVVSVLARVTEEPACTAARCDDGSCRTEDRDGDGVGVCLAGEPLGACDCDDADRDVRPGAPDPCGDRVDQDCDGFDDECDADCDGFPEGRAGVADGRDCDDSDPEVHPSGSPSDLWGLADGDRLTHGCEAMPTPMPVSDACMRDAMGMPVGDGIDQDCNGFVDDGAGCTDPNDRDRDGARACEAGETRGCDTDDCDPGIAPSREEVCGNEIDENSDGVTEPCDPGDGDGDGQRATSAGGTDCDDADPRTFLGAPDDCRTPEAESCEAPIGCAEQGGDADGDGYVARATSGRGDCDDTDPTIRPFAGEDPCDGVDNDCDGIVDEVVRPRDPTPGVFDGCVRAGGGAVPLDYNASSASSEHCGGCGLATSADEDCCGGVRTPIDQVGQCGACGRGCGIHTRCQESGTNEDGNVYECVCAPDATGRWADCDGTIPSGGGCESDLDTDVSNCGTCGRPCGPNERCEAGSCVCEGSFLDCDGMTSTGCEVNGALDVANCGRCGMACTLAAASEACVMGACAIASCDAGFGDCDMAAANGCETPLSTLTHCGRCGETCGSIANATRTCSSARRCDYTSCTSGFADCDMNRSNGCETATSSTLTACGSCTTNCNTTVLNATGRTCVMSTCGYGACAAGFGDCDANRANGCERALDTITHCGACGNACGAGETCNASGDCACGATAAPSGPACGATAVCMVGTCVPI
jgi:hypothetical protein